MKDNIKLTKYNLKFYQKLYDKYEDDFPIMKYELLNAINDETNLLNALTSPDQDKDKIEKMINETTISFRLISWLDFVGEKNKIKTRKVANTDDGQHVDSE